MGFRVRFAILFGSMLVSMGSAGTLELKLQEGDGSERITVPTDSLCKNLIEVTLALDGASESLYEKTGNPLRDECMCEAPSDTLDIMDGRGNTRKYRIYCSKVTVLGGEQLMRIDLAGEEKDSFLSRCHAIRNKFCKKGFGCSDGRQQK